MMTARLRRVFAAATAAALAAGCMGFSASAEERAGNAPAASETSVVTASEGVTPDYDEYLEIYASEDRPDAAVSAGTKALSDGAVLETADGTEGALLSSEHRTVQFAVNVEKPGLYNILINYYAMKGRIKDIVFSLEIDGKAPFSEAEGISLSRVWKDSGEIGEDSNGNQLRPSQEEVSRWNSTLLANSDGYYEDPYLFLFSEAGEHTVTFGYSEESMLISGISLTAERELASYSEYSSSAEEVPDTVYLLYEAEDSYEKSSSMLYPTSDRSSPATSPSHYSKMRYNTIGQSNWSHQGQWISWKVTVPQDGWYRITLRARQNYQQGINSYRTLKIDGEIPFEEAKNIMFPYDLGWTMKTVGDGSGEPYLFYMSEGDHELSLEVSAGPMGTVLKNLSDSVLELNAIYRSIIMVTGTTPDKYRTYYLEESVPGLMDDIKSVRETLESLYTKIEKITGTGGSQASVVKEMSVMLTEFENKPLSIPTRVGAFKDTIESLGSVILTLSEQPLELDYIIVSGDSTLPDVEAGFIESLVYGVKGFIASFTEDYNSVGSANESDGAGVNLTVWVSNGRDQAQILKNLIDNHFTPDTGIGVSMSIVSTMDGTTSSPLVQATLAGKGPDVALFTPRDTPVNLAMRGALADLSAMDGFDDIYDRFYESAWIPYQYEGGTYGVPESQNFDMLFYRDDIFNELGLEPPETWDEFYAIIELLQKNNLEVGVQETNAANAGISLGIGFFEKLLLQNGGTYYSDDLTETAFNTQAAYNAFTDWTELYLDYGLERSFDFFNRFRTGEMPIGIMSFVTYNQLYSAAPEIRGLWKMTLVPGTPDEDGNIVRTETASGTAAIMLDDCKYKEEAWEFIKWWTDAPAQSSYGSELEASLGVAARYDTANIEAFDSIGWTEEEAAAIKAQWEWVTNVPQIPGNYFISRCLTNAFRTVVDENENPVRSLNIYNKDMNAEITRKREEFGLD